MKINKMISKYNHYNCNDIKYIVIHDTGNFKDTAKDNALYFNGGNRGTSANYFVDENNIYQVVEDSNGSWHCGDGKGAYGITNTNSIGIEMCNSSGYISKKTIQNTIELVQKLMKQYNIDANHVVRHYDASRKICPMNMSKDNWALWKEFKQRLFETSKGFIKLDGGSHGDDINLIIRDFSDNIEKVYAWVDSDDKASFAFSKNILDDRYVKLEKNCSKVIKQRSNGSTFTIGATYKVIVKGYDKNSNVVAENTIVLTIPKEDKLYRVQVGAYRQKENANNMLKNLKEKGFNGFITQ